MQGRNYAHFFIRAGYGKHFPQSKWGKAQELATERPNFSYLKREGSKWGRWCGHHLDLPRANCIHLIWMPSVWPDCELWTRAKQSYCIAGHWQGFWESPIQSLQKNWQDEHWITNVHCAGNCTTLWAKRAAGSAQSPAGGQTLCEFLRDHYQDQCWATQAYNSDKWQQSQKMVWQKACECQL